MSKVRSFGFLAGQLWKANCGIDVVTQELFADCHLTFGAIDTADKRDDNAIAVATVPEVNGIRKVRPHVEAEAERP